MNNNNINMDIQGFNSDNESQGFNSDNDDWQDMAVALLPALDRFVKNNAARLIQKVFRMHMRERAAAILIQKIIRGHKARLDLAVEHFKMIMGGALAEDEQDEANTFKDTRGMTLDQLAQPDISNKRGRSDDESDEPDEPDAKRGRSYEPQSPTLTYCPLYITTPPVKLLYGSDIEFRKIISALGEPHWPASTNIGDRRYDDGTGFVIVDRFNVAKLSLENEDLAIHDTQNPTIFTIRNIVQ